MANQEEMQHVFLNLLRNAEEAVVRSRNKPEITVQCSYAPGSEHIRIDIADNGPGIPSDVHARVFEPFFSTKSRGTGTGLGLMIARRIVDEHGGRIWFETKLDVGTTFSLMLPLVQTN